MRIGYSRWAFYLARLPKRLVVAVAGLLILPLAVHVDRAASIDAHAATLTTVHARPKPDMRAVRLRRFLASLHCPVMGLAEDFVQAADDNHLDWRLLPSISVIESGGGKAYRNNNIFGWNNGTEPFPSIRAGLNMVAFKLGKSQLYRNHDILGKLHLYNPDEAYAPKVLSVMRKISPVADLDPARHLVQRSGEYLYIAD